MTLAKLILIFAFVSAIPIGVTGSADTVVRDLESGDLWANPRLRFLFGFGQNDVLRFENLIGRIHPEDRTRVIAEFARAEQAEGSFKDEFRVIIPGGGEQCVAALDIIERKRAEQDIKAALVEVQTLKERLEEENLYLKEEISEVKGFNEIIGESDVLK